VTRATATPPRIALGLAALERPRFDVAKLHATRDAHEVRRPDARLRAVLDVAEDRARVHLDLHAGRHEDLDVAHRDVDLDGGDGRQLRVA
jgi:hypothetical protein